MIREMLVISVLILTVSSVWASEPMGEKVRKAVVSARNFDVAPDTGRDVGPAFRRMINTVIAANEPVIIELEQGTYRIGSGPSHHAAITIENAFHLTIRGQGNDTEIVLTNPRQGGFFIADSEDVWIESLAVDHDPIPYTQGHIMLVNVEEGWFDFVTQRGYPSLEEAWFAEAPKPYGQWGMIFDAEKPRLKAGAADFIFMDRWNRLGTRAWRMRPVADQRERLKDMHIGDRFVYMARHGKGGAAFFFRSRECGVRNMTVYSSQSLAVGSLATDLVTVDSLSVQRRPNTDRLLSTNSDGVHCQQNIRGPIIKNSSFEGMADDSINIYYYPNTVTGVISDNVLRASRHGIIEAGDMIQFFEPREGRVLGVSEVEEVRPAPEDEYRITLKTPIAGIRPAPDGHSIYNLSRCGADFVIRDNEFRNHRRHGMMIKAPGGVIEGNIIDGVGGLGIVVGNDPEWPEGVIPSDLIIRENSIKDVGRSRWYGRNPRGAAIQLMTQAMGGRPAAERHIRNVVIEENVVVNPPGAAVYMGAVEDVKLTHLRVFYREDGHMPREAAAVIVENAAGVVIDNVRIESQQRDSTAGVLISPCVAPGDAGVTLNAIQITGPPGMKSHIDLRE